MAGAAYWNKRAACTFQRLACLRKEYTGEGQGQNLDEKKVGSGE